MVREELFLHAPLFPGFDVSHDISDFALHALQADILIQFCENLLFALGNKALSGVDVLLFNGLTAAGSRIHKKGFGHHFRQVPVTVAHLRLAHVPGKMGGEFLEGGLGALHLVFLLQ